MSRPNVVTHALLSVDGRLEGFPPEVGLYYELAGRLQHDAILAGSGTMVAAAQSAGVDLADEDEPAAAGAGPDDASLPLLVIVDSQGRLTRFDWLRATGHWRNVLVLGSDRTPPGHRLRLRAGGIRLELFGEDRVDLQAALRALAHDHGIETVRVDAGPGLNTALLAAGLLDEVSVVVAPYLVGRGRTLFDGVPGTDATQMTVTAVDPQPDGHVWLRYTVGR